MVIHVVFGLITGQRLAPLELSLLKNQPSLLGSRKMPLSHRYIGITTGRFLNPGQRFNYSSMFSNNSSLDSG